METKHTPSVVAPWYAITENGDVLSTHNWRGYGYRPLNQTPNSDGYPSVRVIINGQRKRIAVYKLVANAFLPPRPSPKHELRHKDGNRRNSCASNLCWGTRQDNADDREKHGHTSRGEKHSTAIKRGIYGNR